MSSHTRIDKWDNVKCILILLVVVGHFANQFDTKSEIMRVIALFIYTFHMPLFIFMAGLMEKRPGADSRFNWNKVVFYCMIGYILKVLIYLIKCLFDRNGDFEWLTDTGIPWYMFAMAAFYALTYILRKLDSRLILTAGIATACLAGYCNEIDSFLNLSRIIVFFPFYYLGAVFDANRLLRISGKRWVKVLSTAVLAAALTMITLKIDEWYTYIRLLTGRNPYDFINHGDCSFINRLLFFAIAIVVGWAVLNVIPEKHNALMSEIGSRTLQIYFWHRLILYVLMYTGVADSVRTYFGGTLWCIIYLEIAILLTLILSEKKFGLPLKPMKKTSDVLCSRFPVIGKVVIRDLGYLGEDTVHALHVLSGKNSKTNHHKTIKGH